MENMEERERERHVCGFVPRKVKEKENIQEDETYVWFYV